MPLAFYLGVLFQYHLGPDVDPAISGILLSSKVTSLDTGTLQEMWHTIQVKYARKNPSVQDAFDAAGKGMVHAFSAEFGDDFSAYLTPSELARNREFLQGSFGGIGASMTNRAGKLVITAVIAGTPAERAGLKADDVVVTIDGRDVTGLTVDDAVARIRGPVGTHVHLGIQRGTVTAQYDIVRADIVSASVVSKNVAPGVLYVRIKDFGAHTADDFDRTLKDALQSGDNSIILDLRENPGGYVSAADAVVSEFVSSGVSVSVVDRDGHSDNHMVSGKGLAFTQKLVVLVDGQSASAAEITAGALQDHHRARLVGAKTFGKGSVQEDFQLSNGGDLHLTVAHWFTPSGHSIQKDARDPNSGGITPEVAVMLAHPEDFFQADVIGSDPTRDAQLQAALAALR